jgi:hypothetical protein
MSQKRSRTRTVALLTMYLLIGTPWVYFVVG